MLDAILLMLGTLALIVLSIFFLPLVITVGISLYSISTVEHLNIIMWIGIVALNAIGTWLVGYWLDLLRFVLED